MVPPRSTSCSLGQHSTPLIHSDAVHCCYLHFRTWLGPCSQRGFVSTSHKAILLISVCLLHSSTYLRELYCLFLLFHSRLTLPIAPSTLRVKVPSHSRIPQRFFLSPIVVGEVQTHSLYKFLDISKKSGWALQLLPAYSGLLYSR